MPFSRPTLAELIARVQSDFRGRLGISSTLVRRAMADVFGAVWAGGVHMLHGHLDWLSKQLFPDTADREQLLRQASFYSVTPSAASFASGVVEATGTDGGVIPEDTVLQRADGATFRVTADATIASGTASVSVEAVEAGSAGNTAEGVTLAFESPITDVDSTAEVTGDDGISGGFDAETTDETRARLIATWRDPPQGGADHDYVAWATAVAGVTRAWVYPNENGLGTVVVRVVQDGEEDIFPGAPLVAAVQAALDAERPITAEVTAAAPTPLAVDFEILVTPDTTAVHDAVTAELTDLLFREGAPGDGAGRGTILLSKIMVAIGVAGGVDDFTLVSPAADVVPATGQLPIMGTVDWSP